MLRNLALQPSGNNPATGNPFPIQSFTVSIAETMIPGPDPGTAYLNVIFSGFDASLVGVDVPPGLSSTHPFYVADEMPLPMCVDAASLYVGHLLGDSPYGPLITCTDTGLSGGTCGFLSEGEFNAKYGQQMANASAYTPPADPGTPPGPSPTNP